MSAERPHRTAAVLAIGDELILGQKTDTNSAWISDRLTSHGVRVVEHVTVADDMPRLVATMQRLCGGVDLLVMTGGLGPTADDLTREGLAAAMGEPLVEDAAALAQIETWFKGRGRAMPEPNRVQALRPASARCLENPNGTAPGLAGSLKIDGNACDVFCLPGPPNEMTPMFEAFVTPAIRAREGAVVATRAIHTFGLGESDIAARLGPLMNRDRNPLVGTTASLGVVTCRLRFEGDASEVEATEALDKTERVIRGRLGDVIFAIGGEQGEALARAVIDRLRARGERLVLVESCTGGLLGQTITRIPGSSDVLLGGWITYSNEMKSATVGVRKETLDLVGAVSREVAVEMAEGGLAASVAAGGAQHALAITGVAGPGGGSDGKPVGTVWIARASSGEATDVRRFRFRGGRDAVRRWSANTALGMLRLQLDGVEMRLLGQTTG
ncbi:MAG: competence/damage-inducible protein A [Phycisphaerales bacterium]